MLSTPLSTILNRMNRYQVIGTIQEQDKVYDLDDAIRTLERTVEVPWRNKKSTLKIFRDVLVYPTATDHDHLAYLDTSLYSTVSSSNLNFNVNPNARFRYTSLQEFYENYDYRNKIAEIWDRGTKFLGIRYDNGEFDSLLVGSKTLANYSASGDASNLVVDNVVFLEGNNSIRFTNTSSSGTATIQENYSAFSDTNYQRKFYFRWVYLTGVPTSITLRFGTNSSNYLQSVVTAQFSGQAFSINDWNLLSFDLNAPTTSVGTINSNSFGYDACILTGAPTGLYYLDNSYIRDWVLMDYWYYSTNNTSTVGSTTPNRSYFMDSSSNYSLDTSLVGDDEWVDVVMYDALLNGFADEENEITIKRLETKRKDAWEKLLETYPSMKPLIVTSRLYFETDYNNDSGNNY